MQENKQEKSPIKQRILQYLSEKGISAYEFYKNSGVTRGILTQNNGINEDNIARFLVYASDINPGWLVTGEGGMFKQDFSILQENGEKKEDFLVDTPEMLSQDTTTARLIDEISAQRRRAEKCQEQVDSLLELLRYKDNQMGDLLEALLKMMKLVGVTGDAEEALQEAQSSDVSEEFDWDEFDNDTARRLKRRM